MNLGCRNELLGRAVREDNVYLDIFRWKGGRGYRSKGTRSGHDATVCIHDRYGCNFHDGCGELIMYAL